jgi:hypothetical protein
MHQNNSIHVRALLAHFADQFPFDELQAFSVWSWEVFVFSTGPALAR